MQFRLRTLLIVLAVGPPLLASLWLSGPGGVGVAVLFALLGAAAIAVLLFVSWLVGNANN
jgi:hypothetical protein